MSQKSSFPQAAIFVSQVLMSDSIVCGLRTGESNNLKDGIVDLYGVFSCGRLLNERADSSDDLACAIPLLDNKRERVIHLAKIRWLRA